jgi:glycine reductase
MSLKLGTFPVESLVAGSTTDWNNGVLTIDVEGLTALAAEVPNVKRAFIEVVSPGESARIVRVNDVMEPRVKVEGRGQVFPGVCGRPVDPVGEGFTYRLGGLGVIQSTVGERGARIRTSTAAEALELKQNERPQDYIDMSGPGGITPMASLHNVVVSVDADESLGPENQYLATHTAALRVVDAIAETIRDKVPPQVEVMDTSQRDPTLPGIVFICNLMSMEFWTGADSKMGTAVYGVTRLSAPWLLQPEEMFDGAVSQRVSWHFTNSPLVRELMSRHGKDLNFLGCIIQRTNWGGQQEMQLSASRSAQTAKVLGADGAIITTNIRGRRFVDTVLGIQACERAGIRTTLMTEEEDDEDGNAPPLLVYTPEMEAIVSTGAGAVGPFPAVERVLGARNGERETWMGKLPDIAGRYGAFHLQDYYGYGKQGRIDY